MTTEIRKFNSTRRRFLDMVSKAGVSSALWKASPFVGGAMINRAAQAAGETKRFIAFSYPAGAPQGSWLPSSPGSMNQCTQPLLDVARYCQFKLVNVIGGGHGAAHAAMNIGSRDSFDVQMARLISADTPYQGLNLGVRCTTPTDLIGRRGGQPIVPESDPQAAYNQLFGGPPPGGAAQALYLKQKSILDTNKAALDELMKKLGSEEKSRLETHFAALERIDKRLNDASQFVPPAGCADPQMASQNATDNAGGCKSEIMLMSDIAITAMKCGLSNVATIQLDDSQSNWRYEGSFTEAHHQTCHGRSRNDVITITRYINEAVAYTIKTLAETDDPAGGKMIDNTVFLQVTDQDGISHTTGGCPNILATNMSGFPSGVGGGSSNRALMNDIAQGFGLGGLQSSGHMTDIMKNENVV
ncbi:DUF1552 domain-containing protein [Marinagarivorans cellulosilyticus]|uniref:DUF1552 domain-containing protein n=1 Tax=Marinagarivorans cellulosilyticus TaxID=2721545 RepID=A0AAN2BIH6_9GAMM|nr:DUF1552 domain-containing protein [Marinagarivorans cellulosilyticus]BCD95881.1 hypothetical protein MARGE09_P0080 [Marinagarivorans cellulosilyticus]